MKLKNVINDAVPSASFRSIRIPSSQIGIHIENMALDVNLRTLMLTIQDNKTKEFDKRELNMSQIKSGEKTYAGTH